jgi:hypothetical protein
MALGRWSIAARPWYASPRPASAPGLSACAGRLSRRTRSGRRAGSRRRCSAGGDGPRRSTPPAGSAAAGRVRRRTPAPPARTHRGSSPSAPCRRSPAGPPPQVVRVTEEPRQVQAADKARDQALIERDAALAREHAAGRGAPHGGWRAGRGGGGPRRRGSYHRGRRRERTPRADRERARTDELVLQQAGRPATLTAAPVSTTEPHATAPPAAPSPGAPPEKGGLDPMPDQPPHASAFDLPGWPAPRRRLRPRGHQATTPRPVQASCLA